MPRIPTPMIFAALVSSAPLLAVPAPALADAHDGNWSVLIITEKGNCDRGYRYSVNIARGRVHYTGEASLDMSGTVSASGAVKVNIKLGEQGASGTGRLSANSGAGTWHGAGTNGTCAGRWEAERR